MSGFNKSMSVVIEDLNGMPEEKSFRVSPDTLFAFDELQNPMTINIAKSGDSVGPLDIPNLGYLDSLYGSRFHNLEVRVGLLEIRYSELVLGAGGPTRMEWLEANGQSNGTTLTRAQEAHVFTDELTGASQFIMTSGEEGGDLETAKWTDIPSWYVEEIDLWMIEPQERAGPTNEIHFDGGAGSGAYIEIFNEQFWVD